MKLNRIVAMAALVAAVGVSACDENGEVTGLVIADLAGSWEASVLTFSPTTSGSQAQAIPFIALGGALVVDIETTGAFSGTLTVPGAVTGGDPANLPVAGTMSIDDVDGEDIITVDFSAQTEAIFASAGLPFEDFDGPIAMSGSQVTITNETTFDFDLGGPGAEEAALMTMILVEAN